MEDLTFKPTSGQRRGLMVGAAVCLALAVTFAVVAGLAHGRGILGVFVFGLPSLLFISYFLLAGRDFTACDHEGIKCRANGRYHEWAWSEIDDIVVQSYAVRGVPRSVIRVVLNDGSQVGLTVPINGGATKDPAFSEKAEQIREYRSHATEHPHSN